jgi:hypothetical protein
MAHPWAFQVGGVFWSNESKDWSGIDGIDLESIDRSGRIAPDTDICEGVKPSGVKLTFVKSACGR